MTNTITNEKETFIIYFEEIYNNLEEECKTVIMNNSTTTQNYKEKCKKTLYTLNIYIIITFTILLFI